MKVVSYALAAAFSTAQQGIEGKVHGTGVERCYFRLKFLNVEKGEKWGQVLKIALFYSVWRGITDRKKYEEAQRLYFKT